MANDKVEVDVVVDDKGTTKKAALGAKNLGENLDTAAESSKTAQKNVKGVAQTASAGGKNFSKMAQGIQGGIVPAYAVLAANIFAITAAFGFLKRAADLQALQASQVEYAKSTGQALGSVTSRLREASNGMLGFQEAAEAAAIGSAKGFSVSQLEDLAIGATKVSKALGRDFTDSFDRLVRGISKAEPELLDELGITLRLEKATTDYALALDKNADALTDVERSQAVLVSVQKQLNDQFGEVSGAANPFTKLAKTFEDVTKTVTELFLPAFSGIANVLANNAGIALAFFAVMAAGIVKSMPGFAGMTAKMKDFADTQDQKIGEAKEGLQSYNDELDLMVKKLEDAAAIDQAGFQSAKKEASKDVQGLKAKKGSGLEALQKGEDISKRQLTGMLKAAKEGTGEYKNLTDERRVHLIASLEKMEKASKKAEKSTISWAKKGIIWAKKLGKQITTGPHRAMLGFSAAAAGGMKRLAKAGKFAGNQIDRAMRFGPILAMVFGVIKAVQHLIDYPHKFINNLLEMAGTFLKVVNQMVAGLVSGLMGGYNWLMNKLGLEEQEFEVPLIFNTQTIEAGIKRLNDTPAMKSLKEKDDASKNRDTFLATLNKIKDIAKEVNKELIAINEGINKEGITAVEESMKRMTAVQGIGLSSMMKAAGRDAKTVDGLHDPEKYKRAMEGIRAELGPEVERLSPMLFNALFQGFEQGLKAVEKEEVMAGAFTTMTKKAEDDIGNMQKNLQSGDLYNLAASIKPIIDNVNALEKLAAANHLVTDAKLNLDKKLEKSGGMNKFKKDINDLIAAQQQLKIDTISLEFEKAAASRAPGIIAEQMNKQIKLQEEINKLKGLQNLLTQQNITLNGLEGAILEKKDAGAIQKLKAEIAQTEAKIAVQKSGNAQMTKDITEIGQLGLTVGQSLSSNLASAFNSIVTGAKDAKTAFKDMAIGILKSLAQIITKLLIVKLLESTLGGSTFGNWIGIGEESRYGGIQEPPALRYGGITKANKNYAAGGIASGRDAGYPATLHGTEAVVPLPNNRSIPVDLKGAGGQNNVTINVSMDNSGNKSESSSDSMMGENLGQAISMAVQEELQYQKRSGGILNPYGVA